MQFLIRCMFKGLRVESHLQHGCMRLDACLLKRSHCGVFVEIFVFPMGVWSPQSVCLWLHKITYFSFGSRLSDQKWACVCCFLMADTLFVRVFVSRRGYVL